MRIRLLIAALLCVCLVSPAHASIVAITGDFGAASAGSAEVARLIDAWLPDAVVLAGDNYYASVGAPAGQRYDATIGRYWCGYLAGATAGTWCPSGGTSATNRIWPVAGNHDYSDAGIVDFDAYFPTASRHYQVAVGAAELFVLDSEAMRTAPAAAAEQATWLQGALAASTARWKVVILHHPPYVTSVRGSTDAVRLPYEAWGANLVVAAHDHYYERLQVGRVPHVVVGTGGASLSAFPTSAAAESVVHHAGMYGALRLAATPDTLSGSFVTVDGTTRDAFMLATPAPPQDTVPPPQGVSPGPIRPVGNIRIRPRRSADVALARTTPSLAQTARVAITITDRRGRTLTRSVREISVAPMQRTVRLALPRPMRGTVRARVAITAADTTLRHTDWVRVR